MWALVGGVPLVEAEPTFPPSAAPLPAHQDHDVCAIATTIDGQGAAWPPRRAADRVPVPVVFQRRRHRNTGELHATRAEVERVPESGGDMDIEIDLSAIPPVVTLNEPDDFTSSRSSCAG